MQERYNTLQYIYICAFEEFFSGYSFFCKCWFVESTVKDLGVREGPEKTPQLERALSCWLFCSSAQGGWYKPGSHARSLLTLNGSAHARGSPINRLRPTAVCALL